MIATVLRSHFFGLIVVNGCQLFARLRQKLILLLLQGMHG
jgi:hypothetical protein